MDPSPSSPPKRAGGNPIKRIVVFTGLPTS
jgi:hypothetical protein